VAKPRPPASLGKGRFQVRAPVEVGETIADKYRVEGVLAAGGMGVVVTARHKTLGQRVAIKFLLPDVMQDDTVARFLREARAAAMIQSEHVARVFDCGTLPSGVPYMVMEHLDGTDLAHELKARGRLPIEEAVDLVLQAIEGVASAHARGVVHRDLKPSNLFLAGKGGRYRVKVLDFGISKVSSSSPDAPVEDDLTSTTTMLGSPRYMSPEQAQSSRDVDRRTDVWSLGVILYEMLAGVRPFAGSSLGEVISQLISRTPDPVRVHRPEVPEALEAAVAKCLERDRERRFADVAELAAAISPFGPPHAAAAVARVASALEDASPLPLRDETPAPAEGISGRPSAGTAAGSWARTGHRERARRGVSNVVLLVAVAVLGGALSWFIFGRPRGPADDASARSTASSAAVVPSPPPPQTAAAAAAATGAAPAAPSASPSASAAAKASASGEASATPTVKSRAGAATAARATKGPRPKSVGVLDSSD
jgi:serine/threonine-protein kinase